MASRELRYLHLIGKPGFEDACRQIRMGTYRWPRTESNETVSAADEKRRRKMEKRAKHAQGE